MRILVDYRPALRERTGVGELMHNFVRAYTRQPAAALDQVAIFTASWKDRPAPEVTEELGATVIDRRIPVRVLNFLWHRLQWPPVEQLAGPVDVVHAAHPLLIPARRAAQVITVHDLFFLDQREGTSAEVRRDYPDLARAHARRADAIVVPSQYTAGLVTRRLGVGADRIYVCAPGPPAWKTLGRTPNQPRDGYVLFVGTLEPRKNLGLLLDAYAHLLTHGDTPPPLVIAGRATEGSRVWLDRLSRPPLAGHVRHLGYVAAADRESLFAGARALVIPSHDEGFGFPALEAMSAGIPVVATARGALPELLAGAGQTVQPDDTEGLAAALSRLIADDQFARDCAERGLARAATFSWDEAARVLRRAYEHALANRRGRAYAETGGFRRRVAATPKVR